MLVNNVFHILKIFYLTYCHEKGLVKKIKLKTIVTALRQVVTVTAVRAPNCFTK